MNVMHDITQHLGLDLFLEFSSLYFTYEKKIIGWIMKGCLFSSKLEADRIEGKKTKLTIHNQRILKMTTDCGNYGLMGHRNQLRRMGSRTWFIVGQIGALLENGLPFA
jgi:hypothetical protein